MGLPACTIEQCTGRIWDLTSACTILRAWLCGICWAWGFRGVCVLVACQRQCQLCAVALGPACGVVGAGSDGECLHVELKWLALVSGLTAAAAAAAGCGLLQRSAKQRLRGSSAGLCVCIVFPWLYSHTGGQAASTFRGHFYHMNELFIALCCVCAAVLRPLCSVLSNAWQQSVCVC